MVSWPGWPCGASTVKQPRPRLEKQAGAGQARTVCQTVTLRCGSCCRGRRTGSVVAWSSLPQRWGLGRGPRRGPPWVREVTGHLTAFSPDLPFRLRAFLLGLISFLFLLSSEAEAEAVWVMGWGHGDTYHGSQVSEDAARGRAPSLTRNPE